MVIDLWDHINFWIGYRLYLWESRVANGLGNLVIQGYIRLITKLLGGILYFLSPKL